MHHINESIFLVYCGHFSSVMLRINGTWNTVSQSLESRGCGCAGNVYEWPCGSKEWNGCFVKQQVLSDKSYWSPKSDFSLGLVIECDWVTEEMPSSITQSESKSSSVLLPYKQDEVFPLHGVISLKHYILLGKGLLFFLPIHSASTLLQDHLVSGSVRGNNQVIKMAYICKLLLYARHFLRSYNY